MKCHHCDKMFTNISEMEQHLEKVNDHGKEKCDKCGKEFFTKFRLDKHMKVHAEGRTIRFCHYYNSELDCPCEKLGCKFRHEKANVCKYGENCEVRKCQFRHRLGPP